MDIIADSLSVQILSADQIVCGGGSGGLPEFNENDISESYNDTIIKNKINVILKYLRDNTKKSLVFLFMLFNMICNADNNPLIINTTAKQDIYNNDQIVTNVSFNSMNINSIWNTNYTNTLDSAGNLYAVIVQDSTWTVDNNIRFNGRTSGSDSYGSYVIWYNTKPNGVSNNSYLKYYSDTGKVESHYLWNNIATTQVAYQPKNIIEMQGGFTNMTLWINNYSTRELKTLSFNKQILVKGEIYDRFAKISELRQMIQTLSNYVDSVINQQK